jgi:hypothetical protein
VATLEQKIRCLERELTLRKRVYPQRVRCKYMTALEATYEITTLTDILEDYYDQREAAAQQIALFTAEENGQCPTS